jgi:hypothetical protein
MAQVPKRIPATVRQQTSHWLLTSLSDRTTLWLMRPSAFLVCVIMAQVPKRIPATVRQQTSISLVADIVVRPHQAVALAPKRIPGLRYYLHICNQKNHYV